MRTTKSNGSTEIVESLEMEIGSNIHELARQSATFRQPEHGDGEISGTDLGMLLRRVSEGSTREIESLINELHGLRKKLETDGNRIQSDIVRYVELSQGVMQLTAIISDNVKRLPC
jgi:hypothetical protein